MSEFCPESEQIAAYAEGNLTAEEQWRIENHMTVCDGCRREAVLLRVRRGEDSEPLSAALGVKVKSALARTLERRRSERRYVRRTRTYRPARSFPGVAVAAAVLLLAFATVLAVLEWKRRSAVSEVPIAEAPKPTAAPERKAPAAVEKETPRKEKRPPFEERPIPTPKEKEAPRRKETVPPRSTPEIVKGKKEPERALVKTVPEKAPARIFENLTLTDLRGQLAIQRVGRSGSEIPAGMTVVSHGDVITARMPSAFCIEGRHALVLSKDAAVRVASSVGEGATWLAVQAGEVLVEPGGARRSRWAVFDGRRVVLLVRKTRARFAAVHDREGLALLALRDSLEVEREGGPSTELRPGEELVQGAVRRSRRAGRIEAALGRHVPGDRTLFFATCDREDEKRGRWSIGVGRIWKAKNPFALSADEKVHHRVLLRLEQRIPWDQGTVLKFRYRTNARRLRIQIPLPRAQGLLLADVKPARSALNRWATAEIPFSRFMVTGAASILLTSRDRIEELEFRVFQKDVVGSARGFLAVDDIQLLDR